jgi:co-chaperonin GroES (HSP10)
MKLRPLHDWLLVKLDPIPDKIGSIFIDGSAAERLRTATVLRTGPGKYLSWESDRRIPVAVQVGDKVHFFREHLEHQQGKQLVRTLFSELGEDIGLIREPDVLYAKTP